MNTPLRTRVGALALVAVVSAATTAVVLPQATAQSQPAAAPAPSPSPPSSHRPRPAVSRNEIDALVRLVFAIFGKSINKCERTDSWATSRPA